MHELELLRHAPGPDLSGLLADAEKFLKASKAPSTTKAYDSDLRAYLAFCTCNNFPYLPTTVEAVVLYISSLASVAPPLAFSTINRRLAAITFAHRRRGLESPATPSKHYLLREVMGGIRRTLGAAPQGADPLLSDAIRRIAAACPDTLLGTRDRALILLGYAMGSRRSELASVLEVRDLTFTAQGLYIVLRHHKTERFEASPRTIAVPFGEHKDTCPVGAVKVWIEAAGIGETQSSLFRAVDRHGSLGKKALAPRSIAKILAKAVTRAGGAEGKISTHSLRSGMCTQAAINGAEERDIARTTGHRSTGMVRRYIRDADLFRANASAKLGL
jgi:site-specific recombinase XerD